jgi:hypothetical protein
MGDQDLALRYAYYRFKEKSSVPAEFFVDQQTIDLLSKRVFAIDQKQEFSVRNSPHSNCSLL